MEYICHKAFHGMTAAGKIMDIPRGSKHRTIAGFIATQAAQAVCKPDSEDGRRCFAVNDDGRGLDRGALTYAMAYSPREREHADGHVFRFSEDEIAMLTHEYSRWLEDTETIIFNREFFHADLGALEELAERLKIQTEKEEAEHA